MKKTLKLQVNPTQPCLFEKKQTIKLKIIKNQKKTGRIRLQRSIIRSVRNFFTLVHHNNYNSQSISFVTLTFAYDITFQNAEKARKSFLRKLEKRIGTDIRWISVPEKTKKERIHYHLLIYNLPSWISTTERSTRNLQRTWKHGYIDISVATYRSSGIAGYMAKYMAKSFENFKSSSWRGYNCSRNIKRPYVSGSNILAEHMEDIVEGQPELSTEYETKYLGICNFKRYTRAEAL